MAYDDFKTHSVSGIALVIFCILGLAYSLLSGRLIYTVFAALAVMAIFLLPENKFIGSADMISMLGIFSILDISIIPLFIFAVNLLAVISYCTEKFTGKAFICKDGQLAMLPSFFVVFVCFVFPKFI